MQPTASRTANASFTNAGHTIRAKLSFNEAGELTNFWSDDRYQTSPDGKSVKKVRWSTPLGGYRSFQGVRLASGGEAKWHETDREYTYVELTFDDVGQRAIRNLKLTITKVNWFSTYRVHHRVAARFGVGRVFLVRRAAWLRSKPQLPTAIALTAFVFAAFTARRAPAPASEPLSVIA